MEGQHGANRWREHLKDIEREKKLKQIMEDPEFEKLTPEQIALKIQELEHSVEAGAKPEEQFASGSQLAGLNKLSGEQLQRKIQDEQRHLAEYGTFKDKEFEDWAKTKMSPAERARFMAGVERIEKFAARGKRLAWKEIGRAHV